MKRTICLLMLTLSIRGTLLAQNDRLPGNTARLFETPSNSIASRFLVQLEKGNKMQVEWSLNRSLDYAANLDSILRIFMNDIEPLRDSLAGELSIRRIDYRVASPERKEIRVLKYPAAGAGYLVEKGELAALKLEQDTINLVLVDKAPVLIAPGNTFYFREYCRVSFFVNRLEDLPTLLASNHLNEKIATLRKEGSISRKQWALRDDGLWHLKADPAIASLKPNIFTEPIDDFLTVLAQVNLQNYKNYFVPSFAIGLEAVLNNSLMHIDKSNKQYHIALSWEPHFIFQNVQGRLQSFRNDFLQLSFGMGPKGTEAITKSKLMVGSFAWLVNRNGDYYEKNTFRLGVARIALFDDKIRIEPAIYFNDFFKGVTPSVRIVF